MLENVHKEIASHSPSSCFLDCVDVFVDIFGVDAIVAFVFRLKGVFLGRNLLNFGATVSPSFEAPLDDL